MRRFLCLLVACTVATPAWASVAAAGDARMPRRCDAARRARESDGRGRTPVLFVHGFLGSPADFRRDQLRRGDDALPTMLETVAAVEGVSAYTFDYSEHSSQWVTSSAIAPVLAASIRCLAEESGRRVVVVAHSMGGLATRVAQDELLDGRRVSDWLGEVITVGTPTRGVLLLEYTDGRLSAFLVQQVIDGAGRLCTDEPERKRRRLCELLDAANAPATSAMAPGSGQLAALPDWGSGVAVYPIAAELRLRVSVLGLGTTVSLGDIVATVGSATADASPGIEPLVVRCHAELTDLTDLVDRSPCAHGTELANRRIIRAVRDRVRAAVRAARTPQAETRSSSP